MSSREIEIEFKGSRSFTSQQLLAVLKEASGQYKPTCVPTEDNYKAEHFAFCLRRVQNFVASRGYLQARVSEPLLESQVDGPRLVVTLDEGVLYRLGQIKIVGSSLFTPEQLILMLDLKRGNIADGEIIGEWLYQRIKKVYANLGYIQFTAEPEPEFHLNSEGAREGVVNLIVTIEEGRLFIIRTIKFEGNATTPEDILRRQMLVREGEAFNEELFQESIKLLNQMELFAHIDPDKNVDFRTDNESSALNITIHVKQRPH
ncbi:MAG: POTRA domain-containing protein [Pyrinomonadaceae bacterium]